MLDAGFTHNWLHKSYQNKCEKILLTFFQSCILKNNDSYILFKKRLITIYSYF